MKIGKVLFFGSAVFFFALIIFRLSAVVGERNRNVLHLSNNNPVASFTFDLDGQCANTAIKFTNSSTGLDLKYLWSFGDGKTSTVKDPTHVFLTAIGSGEQQFLVSLTVTDKENNTSTVSQVVKVKQLPSMDVGSDKGFVSFEGLSYFLVCENSSSKFTFYNNSITRSSNTLYEIDWGDGSQPYTGSDWTEITHEYDRGIYDIKYTITSANGCKFTKKYGVFVGGNPAVGLGNPGNTNVCVGSQLTFPITGTENNPEGTQYYVYFSDDYNNPQIFDHPAPATVTHTFKNSSCGSFADGFNNSFSVRIIAVNPCSSSAATVVPIYVSENPKPVIEIPKEPVCQDATIQIRNKIEEGKEVTTNGQCTDPRFVWEISPATGWVLESGSLGIINNPLSPNSWVSGSQFIFPKFTEPGTYTVKLTTGNRCGISSREETICVIPKPTPIFELDKALICAPNIIGAKNISDVLQACNLDFYKWSVSFNGGECGSGSDWDFEEGDEYSVNPKFKFNQPGIYTLTLTASTVCGSFPTSQTVVVSAPPIVELNGIQDICVGNSISPLASTRTCDSEVVSYKWSFVGGIPSTSTEEVPGLIRYNTPGEKTIKLEVISACGTTTKTQTFRVNGLPNVNAGDDIEICEGESISLSAKILSEGNYDIQWTAEPNSSILEANTLTPTVSPRISTVYTLIIKNRDTGCENLDQIKVTVIPAPKVGFSLPDQVICSGETSLPVRLLSDPIGEKIRWKVSGNGISNLNVSEGENEIPAFTLINSSNNPIDVVFTAEINREDLGNCTLIPGIYTITVNPRPVHFNEDLETCNQQPFSFVPQGLIFGTEFLWTSIAPNGIVGNTSSTVLKPEISDQLTNQTSAPLTVIYTITPVLRSCQGQPFQLAVKVLPTPIIDFDIPDQILCTGGTTEEVLIESDVLGTVFNWTADPNGVLGVIPSGTGNRIPKQQLINPTENPILVTYTVTGSLVGDNTCVGISKIYQVTVNPSISIAPKISDYSGFQISCTGAGDGSIELNTKGGNGNYSFEWSGPNGFTAITQNLQGIGPGVYKVLIKDDFGCSLEQAFTLNQPDPLEIQLLSKQDIFCSGESTGKISIDVKGGVSSFPYQFRWFRNGLPFNSTLQNLIDVPFGKYEVEVMDRNGCILSFGPVELFQPEVPLVIDYEKTDISCYDANDGFIILDIKGGVPPFQIFWNNNSTRTELNNLGPGTYTVRVLDQAGCLKIQNIIIEDAPVFTILPEIRQISCYGKNDGFIKLNFQGGVGQPKITWNNGEDKSELLNLGPGIYEVLIKDETACEISSTFNIIEPGQLLMEPLVNDALDCENPLSGSIVLGISGGRPPYSYSWDNGATSSNLFNIPAGQYAVQVKDASGCQISGLFEIKRPEPLSIASVRRTYVVCEPRLIEEEIEISISGGVAPYSINWSGGMVTANGQIMKTSQAGLYTVRIADGAGCISTKSFVVKNSEILPDMNFESVAMERYNTHLVNFEIQFFNTSFGNFSAFYWEFGDGNVSLEENPKHTYLKEGKYEVKLSLTDSFGCISIIKKWITIDDFFLVMPNAFTPNGDGVNDYFFPRFINIASLEFWVFNKWGETIFYTNNVNSQGWDGKVEGNDAAPGNYVFKLSFKTLDGRRQDKTEVFLLVK